MADETEAPARYIKLTEGEGGQFQVDSNIEDWGQQLKLLVAGMRDAEVKRALGLLER